MWDTEGCDDAVGVFNQDSGSDQQLLERTGFLWVSYKCCQLLLPLSVRSVLLVFCLACQMTPGMQFPGLQRTDE
jgi:hypothetical protein